MGGAVERALEETVPILQAAKRARLLSSQEIEQVVRRRRNHEYALKNQNASRQEYLKYASFERELANLLQKRADKKKIKKKTVQLIIGKTSSRVNLVYSRAVKAFRGDVDLWLHYARHCVKTGSTRTAQRVLARAIAYRGDCERVWLAAVALHFDTCGDAKGARTLAQRALRAIPHSLVMWKEYFRLEVSYLSKLIIRRLAIGLAPDPAPLQANAPQQPASANEDTGRIMTSLQTPIDPAENETSNCEAESDISPVDATAEDRIAEVDDRIEQAEPSESDASDEGSAAEIDSNISGSSSDGESDQETEEVEELSFWNGGVPMTVFKRACDKVNLTAEVLLELWIIAVSSPYIPPLFLTTLSKFICKRFPNLVISRLIEARAEWDCTRSEYHRQIGGTEEDSGRGESSRDSSSCRSREMLDAATKVPGRLANVLRSERMSKLSDSEQVAFVACIKDVESTLKRTAISAKVADDVKELLLLFDEGKPDVDGTAPNKSTNGEDTELNSESWSIDSLEHAIAQGKTDRGDWKSGDVVSAVKQRARVPFRDVHHDKVIGQFFAIETNIKAIREITDILLATPPLTMEGLRHVIAAEIRIFDESATSFDSVLSEETKTRLRRLFAKCEALPSARHDVDFWLLFIDFERRKAKESRTASTVYAKALRTLTREKVTLFTELHTLRNLG